MVEGWGSGCLQAMSCSQREVWLVGGSKNFPPESQRFSGVGLVRGRFASEAEFSKGYRHFASVVPLAKCGIAVKAEASLRELGSVVSVSL